MNFWDPRHSMGSCQGWCQASGSLVCPLGFLFLLPLKPWCTIFWLYVASCLLSSSSSQTLCVHHSWRELSTRPCLVGSGQTGSCLPGSCSLWPSSFGLGQPSIFHSWFVLGVWSFSEGLRFHLFRSHDRQAPLSPSHLTLSLPPFWKFFPFVDLALALLHESLMNKYVFSSQLITSSLELTQV